MTSFLLPSTPAADISARSSAGPAGAKPDPGTRHDFDQVMSGFSGVAPTSTRGPSLFSQMVRVPSQAFAEGLANIEQPTPEGMSVIDSMKFTTQKQIEFSELKILNNLTSTVVRMVRKDIETVLNSK